MSFTSITSVIMLSKGLGEGSALSTLADQPSIDLGSNLASLPLPSLYIHSLTFPLHPRPPSWPCFHRYGPTLLYNLSILLSFLNTSDIRVSNMIIELSYSCIIVDNVQKLLLNWTFQLTLSAFSQLIAIMEITYWILWVSHCQVFYMHYLI